MLKFIGIGDAFSTSLGNCSGFYKKDNRLIIIDCGETIFERIKNNNLLEGINKVDIIITHFHSDHVGSLGTLLFYLDMLEINDKRVIYPNSKDMNTLLHLFGVEECTYQVLTPKDVSDFHIEEVKQEYCDIDAFGYLMNIDDENIYYSGDTKSIDERVLNKLFNNELDHFYQDVRIEENDWHMSLGKLNRLVPYEYRNKIECMHLNENLDKSILESNGYRLVKEYRKE